MLGSKILLAVPAAVLVLAVSAMVDVPWLQALVLVVGVPVYLWCLYELLDHVDKQRH